jgi:hypothetical protein
MLPIFILYEKNRFHKQQEKGNLLEYLGNLSKSSRAQTKAIEESRALVRVPLFRRWTGIGKPKRGTAHGKARDQKKTYPRRADRKETAWRRKRDHQEVKGRRAMKKHNIGRFSFFLCLLVCKLLSFQ